MMHDCVSWVRIHSRPVARLALCTVLLSIGATCTMARADDFKVWVCRAEGVYTTCPATRSWKPCQEYKAEGVGIAEEKFAAGLQAEEVCSENMIELMKLGGAGNSAKVKMLCTRGMCELSHESLENLQSLRTRISGTDEMQPEMETE